MTAESINDMNQSSIMRRRSMPHAYADGAPPIPRRMSTATSGDTMTFGGNVGNLSSYHFGAQPPMPPGFPTVDNAHLGMPNQMPTYMTDGSGYTSMSPDLMGSMIPSTFANMNMETMGVNPHAMSMFPPAASASMGPSYAPAQLDPVTNDFSMSITSDPVPLSTAPPPPSTAAGSMSEAAESLMTSSHAFAPLGTHTPQDQSSSVAGAGLEPPVSSYRQNVPSPLSQQAVSASSFNTADTQRTGSTSGSNTPVNGPAPRPVLSEPDKEKNIYSKSGFDMLKALWLVATREDPKIHLGAVDMSCAFVVCDVTMSDCPIVYVSDNFQNLTGYSRHEIVGKNCRFLQAPDGKVEAGSKREFVDDGAVFNLKTMIQEGREVQQSLINYRKGGKPFLNLLTMIPIPWDTDEIRYFIGFQIDLVECPDAIASGQELGRVQVNYKHSDIGQYIWNPPTSSQWEPDNSQTLGVEDVSTLLQQFNPKGLSDVHRQSWDKMLLENLDDVVHVLSLKGLFLYLSPSCKRILEYDTSDLVGNSLSTVCHPSDIVPVTRELKEASSGSPVNIVFRIRRKNSGYCWFESHGSLFVEQGKGRKCIIFVGRKRPVVALSRRSLEAHGGIGDSELWTKLSTSGMFLYVSSHIRPLLDLQPEALVGTSIQDLMRKETRADFGRSIEKARRGQIVTCKHEVQNRRGQVLQAQTVLYPGDALEGEKPSFLLAQTRLLKVSSRSIAPAGSAKSGSVAAHSDTQKPAHGQISQPAGAQVGPGNQDVALASDDNMFDELRTTKCSSWQFELRQMEKINRILAEELGGLLSNKKKRKRRKGVGNIVRDCANCHTRNTPEWRRGPSGQRDLCNSCGLRWAKQTGRVSPRNSRGGNTVDGQSKRSNSPAYSSPLHRDMSSNSPNPANAAGTGGSSGTGADGNMLNSTPLAGKVSAVTPMTAASGAASALVSATMPPPSQSSMTGSGPTGGQSMTSIREEHEHSHAA
ncbi:PAS fold [Geosmithia morbida]|uniref:PAS fold n=1 Tax=Geosmithia morbida TaxID=1094350 RepID=A0A9P4YTR2_9HYPO|nr:PAS fold [Geosmithia morbida]KAF4121614.1 PAS fold [Geosmithia morbida]